ncbi:outer membrane protein transport protein [Flavobacterium sp. SUN052]|uniref:OmpP1/FadL family transporter n=1 Tax=Flavobacterium sp. SUN052 TaxID=3002441 RepID=UPI00237E864E|nr:outer membrane protein transport protein [Flavobacterium sp. SUN052]MEC4003899.1 outer membrane protein transport protein [Flavobacterium sp. SUN052]
MKKIFAIVLGSLAMTSVHAQDINDALRYAQTDLNGTARFRAMSGAFGALGGDFSSLNINPAGSSIFANNQVGFTLGNYNTKNNSNYFGKNTNASNNSFDLNQAGAVFVFNNDDSKSNWKKLGLAVNYENTKNLDNSLFSAGTNANNSVDNYFLSYANGVQFGNLNNYYFDELYYNEQQAYLGYNSYIIDPNDSTNPNNTGYYSNVATGGNYYQENRVKSTGYNSKLAFNISGQYTDKWYFGLNLNSHFLDYRQSSSFFETNSNPKYATGSTVDVIRFSNDLYTYGSGFSFQLGTIYKPAKEVRLGFAYESATWYRLTDELSQRVVTSGYGLNATQDNTQYNTNIVTDPNVTMIFQPYKLQTPSKLTGSFAYLFGKKGLLSIDYAVKDYSNTKYKPKNDFTTANSTMSNLLTSASEVRIGGEYKIKKLSIRGGYRWEQSPYKDGKTVGDLTGYSGGLGYNFGTTKLDLAYAYAKREYNQQFFTQGLTDAARINAVNNNVSLTLLFEL